MKGSSERKAPISFPHSFFSFLIYSLFPFFLTSCVEPKTIAQLAQVARKSVVLITYADIKGHGTGFFVPGNVGACTVLTVAHVAKTSQKLELTTPDKKLYQVSSVQLLDKLDLALLRFEVENHETCPYPALELGDSDKVQIGNSVLLAGYPTRDGSSSIVLQFPDGKITTVEDPPLPEGYAISYDVTTVGGMSGSPVLDAMGKVIAVHGQTDVEILSMVQKQQGSLSAEQVAKVAKISDRVEQPTQINHFKWGVPVKRYSLEQDRLAQQAKTDAAEAEKAFDQGKKFYSEGEYLKAKEAYDKAIQLKNNYADAYHNRGVARHYLDDKKGAIEDYDESLRLKHTKAWKVYTHRASTYIDLGNNEDAINDCSKAIELINNYIFLEKNKEIMKSSSSLDIKDNEISEYEKSSQINNSKAWEEYKKREYIYSNLSKNPSDLFDKYKDLEIKNDKYYVYNVRGIAYFNLGQKKEAIANYDKAIEIKSDNSSAYLNRGKAHYDLGYKKEAMADYNKAIEINNNSSIYYYARGNIHFDLDNVKGAIADYDKAIEINRDWLNLNLWAAYYMRGSASSELGNKKEAIADYNKSIELKDDYVYSYYNRGEAHLDLGNNKNAIADYSKAIQLKDNFADAYYKRGNAYSALGNKNDAFTDYSKATRIKLDYADAHYAKGLILKDLGAKELALQAFQKAENLYEHQNNSENLKRTRKQIKELSL